MQDNHILGKYTPPLAPALPEAHVQRSAVAALVGRCEGLIWDNELLPEAERVRLFALFRETCAAFDMAPPKMERDPA